MVLFNTVIGDVLSRKRLPLPL